MRALKITTNCEVQEIELQEPLHLSIRESLGGWLEIVRPGTVPFPLVIIVDEEGLLKNLPLNPVGSYMYQTWRHRQPIVGDIIVMREQMGADGIELIGLEQPHIVQVAAFVRQIAQRIGA